MPVSYHVSHIPSSKCPRAPHGTTVLRACYEAPCYKHNGHATIMGRLRHTRYLRCVVQLSPVYMYCKMLCATDTRALIGYRLHPNPGGRPSGSASPYVRHTRPMHLTMSSPPLWNCVLRHNLLATPPSLSISTM